MPQTCVCTTTELPRDGASLRFLLDDRTAPIHGTYSAGMFRSRWATYDTARVSEWCAIDINPDAVPIATVRTANNERSLTLLKQFSRLFAESGVATIDASSALTPSYSNQMSS